MTASIWRENTTTAVGDGVMSFRYAERALSNFSSDSRTASRSLSRSVTVSPRSVRSLANFLPEVVFRSILPPPPTEAADAAATPPDSPPSCAAATAPPPAAASISLMASFRLFSRMSTCRWWLCVACHVSATLSSWRVSRANMQLTTHPLPNTPSSFPLTAASISPLVQALTLHMSSSATSFMKLRTSLRFRSSQALPSPSTLSALALDSSRPSSLRRPPPARPRSAFRSNGGSDSAPSSSGGSDGKTPESVRPVSAAAAAAAATATTL
mmetsp:Transcript_31452/g.78934  ORF Transcript_31452/g.78934 Transcript_31452/m.78934 type:complete len:269 (+) Transcript_31452:1793-2599(+)